ncbi:DUF6737 family protein [Almyronema epifaneia]|uniref:DUF6737 family protein n=1 Tax=Almyronema epifaneia S1 TaxID=2991925 RepID=A0ABW6IC81_9CYAN
MSQSLPPSLWQLKPWWCQPWSIVLTGLAAPAAVWGFSHRLWLAAPVGVGVLLWWLVFLYWVPKQYKAYVQGAQAPDETAT